MQHATGMDGDAHLFHINDCPPIVLHSQNQHTVLHRVNSIDSEPELYESDYTFDDRLVDSKRQKFYLISKCCFLFISRMAKIN